MTGKIVRIVEDKSFGFIRADSNQVEYFFHRSGFDGHWNDLVENFGKKKEIRVQFEDVASTKGPRAESVRILE